MISNPALSAPFRQTSSKVRVLDDQLHDVPDPVFLLLEEAAAISPHPLKVILERDGSYSSRNVLLAQITQAREALARDGPDARLLVSFRYERAGFGILSCLDLYE